MSRGGVVLARDPPDGVGYVWRINASQKQPLAVDDLHLARRTSWQDSKPCEACLAANGHGFRPHLHRRVLAQRPHRMQWTPKDGLRI